MAETVLAKMAVQIAVDAANFGKQLSTAQGQLNSFTKGLGNIAKSIGAVFAVQQVASFAFEVAKLAGEAEGVRAAFDKLPESEKLLTDLKNATHDTVSELDLMKRTVQATNFGISLESLPKLLEFAAIRAQQTGQSVDYLVDSIITGIGRKSPLILDNLGISAIALKEKMNGVAVATASVGEVADAVGQIAADGLAKMGQFSDNTSSKVQKLSASWDNFKVILGDVVNESGVLTGALNLATEALQTIQDAKKGGGNFDILAAAFGSGSNIVFYIDKFKELRKELGKPIPTSNLQELIKQYGLNTAQADAFLKTVAAINGEIKKSPGTLEVVKKDQVTTLESLQEQLKGLNTEFEQTGVNDKKSLLSLASQIISINTQIKALEELRKARENANVATDSIKAYQLAIKKLNEELENVNTTDTERIRIIQSQIDGYQEAINKVKGLGEALDKLSKFDPANATASTQAFAGDKFKNTLFNPEQFLNGDDAKKKTKQLIDDLYRQTFDGTKRLKDLAVDIGPQISGSITSAIVGIGEALGGAISGTEKFGTAILKVVAGFAKQLGEILIATGVGMLAAKALITNPYTAIIAGVALVALASAAQGAIGGAHAKAFGGSSSGGGGSSGSSAKFSRETPGQQIVLVQGEFKVKGKDLSLVLAQAGRTQQITG